MMNLVNYINSYVLQLCWALPLSDVYIIHVEMASSLPYFHTVDGGSMAVRNVSTL